MSSRARKKYYVVWEGNTTGVYSTWVECQVATKGYSNPKFKSFPTLDSAETAFQDGPKKYWGKNIFISELSDVELSVIGSPVENSLCVDAAYSSASLLMEYKGVWNHDKNTAFQQGPFPNATNNIGEFLALVHALAYMKKNDINWPIYSDSRTAISWVNRVKVKSRFLQDGQTDNNINDLVERALHWLSSNTYTNDILRWNTKAWGQIPADFGRK